MTTIAWDGKTLAGDTCSSSDGIYIGEVNKLFTLKSGSIIGFSGVIDPRDLINLLNQTDDNPSREDLLALNQEFEVLLISQNKDIYHIVCGAEPKFAQMYKIGNKKSSCGSGGTLAEVAMSLGATAEEAVLQACAFDLRSRPPIMTLKLKKQVVFKEEV